MLVNFFYPSLVYQINFPSILATLASRLEQEGSQENLRSAAICYICAGNLDGFVSSWLKNKPPPDSSPSELQVCLI